MRRPLTVFLALAALSTAGCAAQRASSVEVAAPSPTVSEPAPRPSASPGLESRGPAEIVHSVDTDKKVVFLTIDDGLDPDPELLTYLKDNDIPVTVFLTTGTVGDWQYWKDIAPVASIQNHTVVHPALPKLGTAGEEQEICAANEAIVDNTQTQPWMLRPPYGDYDAGTVAAAGQCGLDYVVHWSVSLPGKKLEYQSVGASLQPGDIILTHFRKDLRAALPKVLEDIKAQGFELGRLEDYLTPRGWPVADSGDVQMATETESRAFRVAG